MQKSKIITLSILLIILVYILLSQCFLTSLGNIYTFIINPLFFIILSLILKFFIAPPYSTSKFKKDIIQYALIAVLAYCLIYLLSGLLVGFGKNPYSISIRGLIFNLYSTGIIIFLKEYIRYKLINNVYNDDKTLVFVVIVIVFSLLDFNISAVFSDLNLYNIFKQIFYVLIPSVLKNILFTYIVKHTDYIPSFIYQIIYYLILWLSPILPKSPWVLEAILDSIFPLMLLLYCRYHINKKERFHLNRVGSPINPSGLIPFGILLVIIIWFALGIFPIKPVGVATGSMIPELNVGDLAIIQKCNANDIKLQDIIEYKLEGYTVIHRVINIDQKDGHFYFTTKGDNNENKDALPVSEDQLIGKVIFKIPYVAIPTVWLHNLNGKTQVDVETGV